MKTTLVERLDTHTAVAVGCDCGWRGTDTDPASGLVSAGVLRCPQCERYVEYLYEEGERCGNCKRLDHEMPVKDDACRYCSRQCLLQAEYARTLKGAA